MTLFNDGLGRTISRDPEILPHLATQYRNSSLMLLAQAGIEIEFLLAQIEKLNSALEAKEAAKPAKAAPKKE
jgi:hypothetical protein